MVLEAYAYIPQRRHIVLQRYRFARDPADIKDRWRVVFIDGEKWQVRSYVPENRFLEEIGYMEKHSRLELFYLVERRIMPVISKDGRKGLR